MVLRILVVQNAEWESPGLIGLGARAAGVGLSTVRMFRGARGAQGVPFEGLERGSFAAVVALGSPSTAYRPETNPHHDELFELFKLVRRLKIPSFTICYSMQLFAMVHGGRVEKNPNGKEVGFSQVSLTREGIADPVFGGIGDFTTLQWHGDCVTELPIGAVHLGFSEQTRHQLAVLDDIHYMVQGDGQAAIPRMLKEWMRRDRKWAFAGTTLSREGALQIADEYGPYLRNTYIRLTANFLALAVPRPGT